MTETTTPKILFVINQRSGPQRKDFESAIKKYCEQMPWSVHFFLLNEKFETAPLDRLIDEVKPDTIAAVGGDGTVSMVAQKVVGTSIKLAIIPCGSANGMAKELSIPEDLIMALQILSTGVSKKIDVLYVNKKLCLHLSDIGLNARLIKYFQQGQMRGHWGYAKVALKVFFQKRNMRVVIRTGDSRVKRNALMVVLANASKYGTGAVINPMGILNDGLFEVVVIKQMGLMTLLKMWFQPKGISPEYTEIIQAQEVIIHTNKMIHFQVDGEYIGKVNSIDATILPAQLNIITPKEI